MNKLTQYVKASKLELSKVIFPLKNQVKTALISVVIVVAIAALFLTLIDLTMSSLVSWILG